MKLMRASLYVFTLFAALLLVRTRPVFAQPLSSSSSSSSGSSGSSSTITIADGGSQNPIFLTDFPSTGASNRTFTATYTIGSSLSGCARLALTSPDPGITITTNTAGAGATDLSLAAGSTTNETFFVTLANGAVPIGDTSFTITVSCTGGSGTTNSIPVIIGRTAAVIVTVDGSIQDELASITVPTTGTTSRNFALGYQLLGNAVNCTRSVTNLTTDPAAVGISANITTNAVIDNVSQETLTLTFSPGALANPYDFLVTVSCTNPNNGQAITPLYRRIIGLEKGIPLSISMNDPSSGQVTTGSTTVNSVPTVGTYTGVFPLTYNIGSGATNCIRQAIATPPSNVEVSSNSLNQDNLMLEQRDLTTVREEDVTVSYLNPTTPQSYSLTVTISCSNTSPKQASFTIRLNRTQASTTTASIGLAYNDHTTAATGVLNDADLLSLPHTGAVQRNLEIYWTLPQGATGCSVYREDMTSSVPDYGNGPQAPANSALSQGTDPYSYTGYAVTTSGLNPNFTISFAANELDSSTGVYLMRYAIYCTSDPSLYQSVQVAFARYLSDSVLLNGCINSTLVYPPLTSSQGAQLAPTMQQALDVPSNTSKTLGLAATSSSSATPTPVSSGTTTVGGNTIDLSTYVPPTQTITNTTPSAAASTTPLVQDNPCPTSGGTTGGSSGGGTGGGGGTSGNAPSGGLNAGGAAAWNYALGSRRWSN